MTEEIFEQILPIILYGNIESVIGGVNAGGWPLGLFMYSDNLDEVNKIIDKTNSGGAATNCTAMQGALPSPGFGRSGNRGMGRHHGIEGARNSQIPEPYSHEERIIRI